MATSASLVDAVDDDTLQAQFRRDVLAGLSQPNKAIPARWFYDHRGSELFEQITQLAEYYPTRTEIGILSERCAEIGDAVGRGRVVVEFGAGSATKTPLLLDSIAPAGYVPMDISGDFLRESCVPLAQRYPGLPIHPLEADFTQPVQIPAALSHHPLLGFFPGSTIGNMGPLAATDLLRTMRATLGDESLLLIGMDLVKDTAVLEAAYDDAGGVTGEFNLNLARRINRELEGTIPVESLRHVARWNDAYARVEMHLEAMQDIRFTVSGESFEMKAGETIHTENSHKFTRRSADMLLHAGGWSPRERWLDGEERFSLILAEATDPRKAP